MGFVLVLAAQSPPAVAPELNFDAFASLGVQSAQAQQSDQRHRPKGRQPVAANVSKPENISPTCGGA